MVAVVGHAGFPSETCGALAGSAAKQLAAVSSHCLSTSAPEQLRLPSPMSSLAVNA